MDPARDQQWHCLDRGYPDRLGEPNLQPGHSWRRLMPIWQRESEKGVPLHVERRPQGLYRCRYLPDEDTSPAHACRPGQKLPRSQISSRRICRYPYQHDHEHPCHRRFPCMAPQLHLALRVRLEDSLWLRRYPPILELGLGRRSPPRLTPLQRRRIQHGFQRRIHLRPQ